jgi:type IV secretory pathway VirB2 component (pilin)
MKRHRLLPSIAASAIASAAQAQQVTLDPAGSSPILSALNWLQGSLMGNVATAAAVIAIGVIGFMMLTGRIDWRRGVVVVLGCFVLFGAAAIVSGIRQVAGA